MSIPQFRPDGFLPEGLYSGTDAEITFRFGGGSRRRRRLVMRLRRWIELGRAIAARRLLVDGSFVTAKIEPKDVDAVMLIPLNFEELVARGDIAAVELEESFVTLRPEELFAAEDDADWDAWVEFFGRTREPDGRRKGIVEVVL